jgi:hypothetical protein
MTKKSAENLDIVEEYEGKVGFCGRNSGTLATLLRTRGGNLSRLRSSTESLFKNDPQLGVQS